jgi:hypothetical protein
VVADGGRWHGSPAWKKNTPFAVPVSLHQAYANLEAELGRMITEDDKSNINHIYSMIAGAAGGGNYNGEFLRGDGSSIDLDISAFTDPNSKNAADLVTYAIHAWESGWGYVWGTYGDVLTESLFAYKLDQYPDGVGNYEDFIRANWLGGRTTDCVGLIKGYGWLSPETMTIDYGPHGYAGYWCQPDVLQCHRVRNHRYHAGYSRSCRLA